jgi:hypothetical protein
VARIEHGLRAASTPRASSRDVRVLGAIGVIQLDRPSTWRPRHARPSSRRVAAPVPRPDLRDAAVRDRDEDLDRIAGAWWRVRVLSRQRHRHRRRQDRRHGCAGRPRTRAASASPSSSPRRPAWGRRAGDLDVVRRLSGVTDLHELVRYRDALAPASAGAGITPERVADAVAGLADRTSCSSRARAACSCACDPDGGTLADVAARLDAPCSSSSGRVGNAEPHGAHDRGARRSRPGLRGHRHRRVAGRPDLAARRNLEDLETYAGVRLRGRMPAGAVTWSPRRSFPPRGRT